MLASMLMLASLWIVKLELMACYLPFLQPLCERSSNSDYPAPLFRWRCVFKQASRWGDISLLAELMFPYLTKINRDWPQLSGGNSFLGGSLLGQRWFLRMLNASSCPSQQVKTKRDRTKCETWELIMILYNTDKSSTFFHWKARAILRLWVLNKRRCYFWHLGCDWLKRLGKITFDWLYLMPISSAPSYFPFSLVYYKLHVRDRDAGCARLVLLLMPEEHWTGGVSFGNVASHSGDEVG